MFKQFLSLAACSVVLSIGSGCSPLGTTDPTRAITSTVGSFACLFSMEGAPSTVKKLDGSLSNAGDTVKFPFTIDTAQKLAWAQVNNLSVGTYRLEVNARDKNGNVLYYGVTEATVIAGQLTAVHLTLHPATGGLLIEVTWATTDNDTIWQDTSVTDTTTWDSTGVVDTTTHNDTTGINGNFKYHATVTIAATSPWVATGVRLTAGMQFGVVSSGEWNVNPSHGVYYGADGYVGSSCPASYPLPGILEGCLIGRIGINGTPFKVGSLYLDTARETGELYLMTDDALYYVGLLDNSGSVTSVISYN